MKKWECMPRKKLEQRAERQEKFIKQAEKAMDRGNAKFHHLYACAYQTLILSWDPIFTRWPHEQLKIWAKDFNITDETIGELHAKLRARLEEEKAK